MPTDEGTALVIDLAVWTVAGLSVGFAHHRLPTTRLRKDGSLTRIRGWERDGGWYQCTFRIRTWKDLLPDAGAFFRGGLSKRSLPSPDCGGLERFAVETRRAERVHWCLLSLGPVFWLWNPPALAMVMTAYAVIANVPFIMVQRFNRARVLRILRRRAASVGASPLH